MINLVDAFPQILQEATTWVAAGEARILREGRELSPQELEDAKLAGVRYGARIRVMEVAQIPIPEGEILGQANEQVHFITEQSGGLTLGYGIYVRQDVAGDRRLLVHEFVHVAQYERLGGIENFLRDYLMECLRDGYPYGPLERESDEVSRRIVGLR